MNKVPTESLIRLLECYVPDHWLRIMAAEILQARGEYEKAIEEIKKKWEGAEGG